MTFKCVNEMLFKGLKDIMSVQFFQCDWESFPGQNQIKTTDQRAQRAGGDS